MFQDTQQKWMEQMLTNQNNLCDTIFVVGPEKQKMYGLRALLANISPIFKAQFYGGFKEANADEVVEYPTIPAAAFQCILRVSFGLDPCISSNTAVPLMEAANMLQIEALQRECQHFLKHCINPHNVLFLLHSAYCLNSLDENLYLKCRSIILQSSPLDILRNEGFCGMHPHLLIDIIRSNEFKANEENIWSAVLKWAQNVADKNIKFAKKNNEDILQSLQCKHADDGKDEEEEEEEEAGDMTVERALKPIIPFIRFPLMEKTFFVENVRKYLSREQSESVLIFYLLGTRSMFNHERRRSFVSFQIVAANKEFASAQKLADLEQDSLWCSQPLHENEQHYFVVDIMFVGAITRLEIKNRYSDKDTVKTFKLQISKWSTKYDADDERQWSDIQRFQSRKTDTWQTFNVNLDNVGSKKSRYWRVVLLETYGGYSCVNHLKLAVHF